MKKISKQSQIKDKKGLNFIQKYFKQLEEKKQKRLLEKEEKKRKELDYQKRLSELKYTTKINLKEMISDLRYFKPGFWNRMYQKIFPTELCMCIIHYPENRDLIRYFPMVKAFVLDINKTWYLFSPKSFRYINGMAKLEFYANIPYAIIHNVSDFHKPVEMDAEAFTSVQQSKFIQDAVSVEDENIALKDIILYVGLGLIFLANVGIIIFLVIISKKLPH